MAYQTASELTKMMLEYLRDNGNDVWRNNNLAVRGRTFIGRKGVPDIIGYSKKYGTFVACEVKAIGDKISSEQLMFLNELAYAGGIAMLCKQIRDERIIINIFKDGDTKDFELKDGKII